MACTFPLLWQNYSFSILTTGRYGRNSRRENKTYAGSGYSTHIPKPNAKLWQREFAWQRIRQLSRLLVIVKLSALFWMGMPGYAQSLPVACRSSRVLSTAVVTKAGAAIARGARRPTRKLWHLIVKWIQREEEKMMVGLRSL